MNSYKKMDNLINSIRLELKRINVDLDTANLSDIRFNEIQSDLNQIKTELDCIQDSYLHIADINYRTHYGKIYRELNNNYIDISNKYTLISEQKQSREEYKQKEEYKNISRRKFIKMLGIAALSLGTANLAIDHFIAPNDSDYYKGKKIPIELLTDDEINNLHISPDYFNQLLQIRDFISNVAETERLTISRSRSLDSNAEDYCTQLENLRIVMEELPSQEEINSTANDLVDTLKLLNKSRFANLLGIENPLQIDTLTPNIFLSWQHIDIYENERRDQKPPIASYGVKNSDFNDFLVALYNIDIATDKKQDIKIADLEDLLRKSEAYITSDFYLKDAETFDVDNEFTNNLRKSLLSRENPDLDQSEELTDEEDMSEKEEPEEEQSYDDERDEY